MIPFISSSSELFDYFAVSDSYVGNLLEHRYLEFVNSLVISMTALLKGFKVPNLFPVETFKN